MGRRRGKRASQVVLSQSAQSGFGWPKIEMKALHHSAKQARERRLRPLGPARGGTPFNLLEMHHGAKRVYVMHGLVSCISFPPLSARCRMCRNQQRIQLASKADGAK